MKSVQRVLVASDLTDRSDRALERARHIAGDGELSVLHVVTADLSDDLANRWRKDAEAFLADRVTGAFAAGLKDIQVVVLAGDAFRIIISEAITRSADLIVLGEPIRQPQADLFPGTTAERVIRFSDRPVLMVRRQGGRAYSRVLVAFDGSDGSIRALRTALDIAPKAEFRVVHAWRPAHVALGEPEVAQQAIANTNDRIKALIHEATSHAITSSTPFGGNVVIDLVEENPYLVLRNESGWPDLLVLGTHSKARLATTTAIGSLANHLLAEPMCDVLVSRP
jgi:nucleotide-binding universal stress UspA family protein